MPLGGRGFRVDINERELAAILEGPEVRRDLQSKAERVTQEAKRLCPTSPAGSDPHPSGWLRSSIGWDIGRDSEGLYADVGTKVEYALPVELGARPHIIESHGPWPLRNRRTGQVFGRIVHHPGNKPQPYLRPALNVIERGE